MRVVRAGRKDSHETFMVGPAVALNVSFMRPKGRSHHVVRTYGHGVLLIELYVSEESLRPAVRECVLAVCEYAGQQVGASEIDALVEQLIDEEPEAVADTLPPASLERVTAAARAVWGPASTPDSEGFTV